MAVRLDHFFSHKYGCQKYCNYTTKIKYFTCSALRKQPIIGQNQSQPTCTVVSLEGGPGPRGADVL